EVDLGAKQIRFHGCETAEAKISVAKTRLALVTSQLSARSGLTNRERKALNREANILRRWLFPDGQGLANQRGQNARLINRHRQALKGGSWRKPNKRERRTARRVYKEEHIQPVQKRPDYRQPILITEKERLELIGRRDKMLKKQLKKQAWFERKHHGQAVTMDSQDCVEATHVITPSEGERLAR